LTTYEGKEKEKGAHNTRRFSMADEELEMIAVIGKIAAALSHSAGHTVEVYKAEESTPNFRVFVTTTDEGEHAVVMLRGSKVTVIPLFKEVPEKLVWHIEILRKEIPAIEVEVFYGEAAESDL
jgi:uracil phosphoribosyltransferase